jgi:hypothetical protein
MMLELNYIVVPSNIEIGVGVCLKYFVDDCRYLSSQVTVRPAWRKIRTGRPETERIRNIVLRLWFGNSLRTGRYTKYDILDEGKSTTFNPISLYKKNKNKKIANYRSSMQYSLNFLCYIKLERGTDLLLSGG